MSLARGSVKSFTNDLWELPPLYYSGHDGFDFGAAGGTRVLAAARGLVTEARYDTYCGWMVEITHDSDGSGYRTRYCHLAEGSIDEFNIYDGKLITTAGTPIGRVGSTGANSTGNHLHFAVERYNGSTWNVTDPFGWDISLSPQDPLVNCNGEQSHNIWEDGWPHLMNEPPTSPPALIEGEYRGGWIGAPSYDTTPPTVSWSSPANNTTVRTQSVILRANASDDSSGVNRVSFNAKYGGSWHGVYIDYTAPYEYTWDLCNSGVPDGDIELGLEAWDNAENHYVYSEHYTNYHINKDYDCSPVPTPTPTPDTSSQWNLNFWNNKDLSGSPVWAGWANPGNYIQYYYDESLVGVNADDFSDRWEQNVYFPSSGEWSFHIRSDDGFRLYIDGQLLAEEWWTAWHDIGPRRYLSTGYHQVRVEHYDDGGPAELHLNWDRYYPPTPTPTATHTPTSTPTQTPTPIFRDYFEPDDTSGQATWISSGVSQEHSIIPIGDVDWVKFSLTTESGIVIETYGTSDADTRMWLYDSGLNEIEFNDDDGNGYYSKIDRVCGIDALPAGTYYVKIDEYGNNSTIDNYEVTYTRTACTAPTATHTPTPTPTATPTSTRTPTPTTTPSSNGDDEKVYLPLILKNSCTLQTIFFDSFSNPNSGWYLDDLDCCKYEYLNGEYRALIKLPGWYAWPALTTQFFSDYVIEADGRLATTMSGGYGLSFAISDDWKQWYNFMVDDGYYRMMKYDNGSLTTLQPWTYSSAINTGTTPNHFKVIREGSKIEVYINSYCKSRIQIGQTN